MGRRELLNNWILRIAALLLCMVVISFCGVSNLYARYTTSASGEASARVAQFKVTETGTMSSAFTIPNMAPGDTKTYEIQVTNQSEVAVRYTITAKTLWDNLPLEFAMLDSSDNKLENGQDIGTAERGKTYTFYLQVTWPRDKNSVSYAQQTDQVEVSLAATQID